MSLSREERTQVFSLIHTEHCEQIIRAIKHLNIIKEDVNPEAIINVLPPLSHTINKLSSLEMMPDLKAKAPTIRAFFQSYIRQLIDCMALTNADNFAVFVQNLEKNWGRHSLIDICITITCHDNYPTHDLLNCIPDSDDMALKTKVHAMDVCFHLSSQLLERYNELAELKAKIRAIASPTAKQEAAPVKKSDKKMDPADLFEKFFGGNFTIPKDSPLNNNNNLPKKK